MPTAQILYTVTHFFGQNLKTIRIQGKLSQAELGKHLNKGQKTIGNWETGYSEPSLNDLICISQFFTISLDQLLKEEIKREPSKAKAGRNRHQENGMQAESFEPALSNIKPASQKIMKEADAIDQNGIVWRDKYITVLEARLSEMTTGTASEKTLNDLMSRVLMLQKMVAGLADKGRI